MTAFETGQRVEEYVRQALPLFEPMEHEYNGALCEDTFDGLLRAGYFGSVQDMPRELQGRDIHFKFVSPLHDAIERKEASVFLESADLLERAMAFEPSAGSHLDMGLQLRDSLEAIGVDARHMRTLKEVEAINRAAAEQAEAEENMEMAKGGSQVARDLAQAEAQ